MDSVVRFRIAAGTVAALLVLAFVGFVNHVVFSRLRESADLVTHTHLVLERISSLSTDVLSIQSISRSLVLTHDLRFKKDYAEAVQSFKNDSSAFL